MCVCVCTHACVASLLGQIPDSAIVWRLLVDLALDVVVCVEMVEATNWRKISEEKATGLQVS